MGALTAGAGGLTPSNTPNGQSVSYGPAIAGGIGGILSGLLGYAMQGRANNSAMQQAQSNNATLFQADQQMSALSARQAAFQRQQQAMLDSQLASNSAQAAANNAAATSILPPAMPNAGRTLPNDGLATIATSPQGILDSPNVGKRTLLGN